METNPLIPHGSNMIYVKVAREIAIDHYDIQTVLNRYGITPDMWEFMQNDPRFTRVLQSEIADWQAANNTQERTKLKAAALLEEWLEEANKRLHHPNEALPAKVQLATLLSRIAGMGSNGAGVEGGGERFSVTINLGADQKLEFTKDVTSKVIEGTAA